MRARLWNRSLLLFCFNKTQSSFVVDVLLLFPQDSRRRDATTTTSEAGRRQDVHVPRFELVRLGAAAPPLHRGNLHLGRGHLLGGAVLGQSRGLGLHDLHGGGFLCAAVGLQSEAGWVGGEKKMKMRRTHEGRGHTVGRGHTQQLLRVQLPTLALRSFVSKLS